MSLEMNSERKIAKEFELTGTKNIKKEASLEAPDI
jgi:hypothetical protein